MSEPDRQSGSDRLPGSGYESVPRVQQPVRRNCRIVYFHTADNPYGNYASMKVQLADANRDTILMRAYGVATKAIANRFPKFNDNVHVIPDSRVPQEGSRYLIIDPCNGRNFFMSWFIVDPRGRLILYREWPCESIYIEGFGYPGPWTIPSGKKMDGDRGDSQRPMGFGLTRYKSEILRLEMLRNENGAWVKRKESEIIEERYMDSRFAGQKILAAREESLTLIEEMAELDMDFLPSPSQGGIDDGIELVNSLLDYDVNRPVDSTNEPRLFIAESCTNSIYSMHEWTGADGLKGAAKDPIDNIRWAACADLEYYPPMRKKTGRVKSY